MARFFRRGVTKIYFLPAIATPAAPTSTEITAGTNLTPRVADTAGWTATTTPIEAPDADTRFVSNIPGSLTPAASSITFNEDDAVTDPDPLRTTLADGTTGFIVFFPKGKSTGKPAEVWPVRSAGPNREYNWTNANARFVVDFATVAEPTKDAVSP